jgi:hypothetical protein
VIVPGGADLMKKKIAPTNTRMVNEIVPMAAARLMPKISVIIVRMKGGCGGAGIPAGGGGNSSGLLGSLMGRRDGMVCHRFAVLANLRLLIWFAMQKC